MLAKLFAYALVSIAASSAVGPHLHLHYSSVRRLRGGCVPLKCSGYRLAGNMNMVQENGISMKAVGSILKFQIHYAIGPRLGLTPAEAALKAPPCPINNVRFVWKWIGHKPDTWFGEIDDSLLDSRCKRKQGAKDELECQLGAIEPGGSLDITVAVRIDKLASVTSSVPVWHYRAWDPDRYAYSGHTAIQHCH